MKNTSLIQVFEVFKVFKVLFLTDHDCIKEKKLTYSKNLAANKQAFDIYKQESLENAQRCLQKNQHVRCDDHHHKGLHQQDLLLHVELLEIRQDFQAREQGHDDEHDGISHHRPGRYHIVF